jgi:hypothetical protein
VAAQSRAAGRRSLSNSRRIRNMMTGVFDPPAIDNDNGVVMSPRECFRRNSGVMSITGTSHPFTLSRDQACAGNGITGERHHESKAGSNRPRCVGAHGKRSKRSTPDHQSNERPASVADIRASSCVCPGRNTAISVVGRRIVPKSRPRAVPGTLRVMSPLTESHYLVLANEPGEMPGSLVLIALFRRRFRSAILLRGGSCRMIDTSSDRPKRHGLAD